MRQTVRALLGVSVLSMVLVAAPSWAGDAAAGKARATVCAACHGADGKAKIPTYPNLAGQNKLYLISALKAYKNKERSAGQAAMMVGQAAGLSDADIENIAEYYSSLKP